MGTWGAGIMADDTAQDVYIDYLDRFNRGTSHPKILREILEEWDDSVTDEDDGPVVWLAIAKAQWDCGALSPRALAKVRRIVAGGAGLERWDDAGTRLYAARKKALAEFLGRIQKPNPKPRKPRKAIKRKPVYRPGDCLAIKLSDGDYGAALVLGAEAESSDPFEENFGTNLIGVLDYKGPEKPELGVFKKRRWLKLTHQTWKGTKEVTNVMASGHRRLKDTLDVVGNIPLRATDPKESNTYGSWDIGRQVIYQDQWDRGVRGDDNYP